MNEEVKNEITRFVRICAMRHGVKQDVVVEQIKEVVKDYGA